MKNGRHQKFNFKLSKLSPHEISKILKNIFKNTIVLQNWTWLWNWSCKVWTRTCFHAYTLTRTKLMWPIFFQMSKISHKTRYIKKNAKNKNKNTKINILILERFWTLKFDWMRRCNRINYRVEWMSVPQSMVSTFCQSLQFRFKHSNLLIFNTAKNVLKQQVFPWADRHKVEPQSF